jgi:dTDP-4-dehydrorhamnose 3,5-epimerase
VKLTPTAIAGPVLVELETISDDRGFFARSFDADEFRAAGLEPAVVQCNISYNRRAGTLRGMHYQEEAAPEPKLIRCTRGAIFDVAVDIRPGSSTWLQHIGVELTAENRLALYLPSLFAHGFQTLVDDTEVFYQMGGWYVPDASRGLRYDDPALGISWPAAVAEISDKDASWPLLENF